ncbi:MAG: type 2 isopentenyl-diphosphate Delta-isomerase [bacterium]|nr:type 2 isopentenyl-diphosphate Delta-isomerase [bacterium]MDE0438144.1 type 2 isopentenyl-diphosphate Delta-isomerase [bacterium]
MSNIENRKREHVEFALSEGSQGRRSALWEDVHLVPVSVPDMGPADVDLSVDFLGHRLSTPLVISGMTGGHARAVEINRNLAVAAEELGLAIGTGSQRAALKDPDLVGTYSVVRTHAPAAFVIGNIGMSQLISQEGESPMGRDEIDRAVSMIDADALAVHLNAVEELVQPEGDRNMRDLSGGIVNAVRWSPVPVIAKETGAGMARETALRLAETGVAALDVGGAGGTSFARIEALRADAIGDTTGVRIGRTFGDWGVPTAVSLLEAGSAGLPLIGTGGVRNGLHAAKAMALGASLVGIGGPFIRAALDGPGAVIAEARLVLEELRVAMVLTGVRDVQGLRRLQPVLVGRAAEWVASRGGTRSTRPRQ